MAKTVLVLRDGDRRDYVNAWDITRYVPCDYSLWMELVGPGQNILTAHMAGCDACNVLFDVCDGSVDLMLDVRGLGAAVDYGRRSFWEAIHRKLKSGGVFMGCKSTLTHRREFRDGVHNLFDGGRNLLGNFEVCKIVSQIKRRGFMPIEEAEAMVV